ncbi:tubulin domain-containing protein [Gymnopilus junonius]|uniref:Tubulin domain-containing protein n=1 Tax=Gymnopilus junonius TaxID=109634 RepID=A0A9P5NLG4_GYMJU|nr:tubulin domain-containing protein [Gymnopilus junonius]
MKEILYIQAGELSNYTGTHFWNTQESYLQADELQVSEIASNISFSETIDAEACRGRATLSPRLLLFDRKSNFGTLGKANALGAIAADEDQSNLPLWGGHSVEYRQSPITKSSYHKQLEDEEEVRTTPSKGIGDVRYWSDFNRLYYLPKSLQQLPDVPDWETTSLDWNQGQELFTRFNEGSELMEGDLRLLVEECDHMQGIQLMNDTDTFGGFMSSFLAYFRDEYQKLPSFTFPLLSGALSSKYDWDEVKRAKRIVNEALYLRTLNELSSLNIPMEHPALWPGSVWASPLNFPSSSIYHQAAILSAHIETCTLPFRLNPNHQDIASVSALLKWRGTSPFAELHGIFPLRRLLISLTS